MWVEQGRSEAVDFDAANPGASVQRPASPRPYIEHPARAPPQFLQDVLHAPASLANLRTVDEAVVIGAALSLSSSAFVLQVRVIAEGGSGEQGRGWGGPQEDDRIGRGCRSPPAACAAAAIVNQPGALLSACSCFASVERWTPGLVRPPWAFCCYKTLPPCPSWCCCR